MIWSIIAIVIFLAALPILWILFLALLCSVGDWFDRVWPGYADREALRQLRQDESSAYNEQKVRVEAEEYAALMEKHYPHMRKES